MSKKPVAIIWNDVHLKTGNEDAVLEAFKYMVEYAKANGISKTIFAGDLFDSRTFQRLKVLDTFDQMLEILDKENMTVDLVPGNHDKTLYGSVDSFLKYYRYHSSVRYFDRPAVQVIDGISLTYIPFFSDDKLIPMLEETKGSDILISHFEMQGSTHLGSVSEKSTINKKLLSKWKKVYLGHYHNHHEITKDIVHLPSFIQNNFGEDSNKGFSVLYDDLSYEIVKGRFKEFTKVVIDLEETNISEIKELVKTYSNNENTVRFELIGTEAKLKGFDKSILDGSGIDLKKKFEKKFTFEDTEKKPELIEKFSKENIFETFKEFCEEKDLDHNDGEYLLKKFFKLKTEVHG